ncbi:MAG: hypothetical protein CBD24_02910 [Euryarchaeota archaeon TMED164]|nr:MAG: hypothetical protein CBD24_02910 [Euryarchaeota archaeon TMED164]|tara:strand:- start:1952 stop:2212 length:261 start_codon:yes stop_codon:yes gene_type:complete
MMTLNLPKKQVNAILVALDAEIEMQLGGRPVDWESFPEVAAMLMAYYTTRCKFEESELTKPNKHMTTPQKYMAEAREIQRRIDNEQ